jgi:hypothetical protein
VPIEKVKSHLQHQACFQNNGGKCADLSKHSKTEEFIQQHQKQSKNDGFSGASKKWAIT